MLLAVELRRAMVTTFYNHIYCLGFLCVTFLLLGIRFFIIVQIHYNDETFRLNSSKVYVV